MKLSQALFLIITVGCSVLAQDRAADLVILNGNVRTMDERRPAAEAVAIAGGRIIAIGSDAEVRKLVGPRTTVIDAGGGLVVPGFNDAHVHFMAVGNTFSTIDLRGATGFGEVADRIRLFARFVPKGRWIIGSGGSEVLFGKFDTAELDAISPDNPVFLYSVGGLSAMANSAALKAAGIKNGKPGVYSGGLFARLRNAVPGDHTRRWAEIAETATNYAASLGVTTVHDTHSDDMAAVYKELERGGKLKTRVYDCIGTDAWRRREDKAVQGRDPVKMVRGGCVKGFHDGDEEWTAKLKADVLAVDKAGWQVAVHAIGGRPNRMTLDIFDDVTKANGPRVRRFRLEHAEGMAEADILRLKPLSVVASVQPYLFGGSSGFYREYYKELRAAARVAYGSDAPMTSFDPMFAFANFGAELSREQLSAVDDILFPYTVGSAYAEFTEAVKGRLLPGYLADVVVLKTDANAVDRAGWKVDTTIVGGKVVYSRADTVRR